MNIDDSKQLGVPEIPPPPVPCGEAEGVQPTKKRTFEEWSDCFQKFIRKVSLYSILTILGAAVICGIVYGIAAWQIAQQ